MGARHLGTRTRGGVTDRLRAPAASPEELAALRTAAAMEHLAAETCREAAGLPFLPDAPGLPGPDALGNADGDGGGTSTIAALLTAAGGHHAEHAKAFDAAVERAGGAPGPGPRPEYAADVHRALTRARTPVDVIALALFLEDRAARTYTAALGRTASPSLRRLYGSVAPVEAQHHAILLAVRARLTGSPGAGGAGITGAFQPTDGASPAPEGRTPR
ncbi:ferritin-like domain-containing protein [Streptomyces sp. NPDC093085]|uniref:ferritin-like domain-containing protein n=1 Tax=Streptomyces sp. NPDC093085 TaxID=3155068 RepID=UPI00341402C0